MSLDNLLRRAGTTATVIHLGSGAPDRYGDAAPSETGRDTYDAIFEQTDSIEIQIGRDTVISGWRAFLPAAAVIAANDRIQRAPDGVVFEVIGAPARPRTPRGEHHVEVRLREVEG